MTIQQLQYVVALDRHRHFVKAAESCCVTQPTLTLQLKKLEEEIATVLFDRSSQPLTTTPLGEIFVKKAEVILQEIQDLKDIVNDDRNQMKGEFRLGVIPTVAPYLLPLFISDFIKKHPETKLIIEELQSEAIIDLLTNRQLDLAILAGPLNEPNIRETTLFHEPFIVFSDEENELLKRETIAQEQLKPKGLWLLRKGHCFRNQTLDICGFDTSVQHKNLSMEGGSIETLKRLVKEVSGYTLIPELSFVEAQDAPNVIRFSEPQPVRSICIATHKHFTKELLINELKKSILANTPASLKKDTKIKMVKWR